MANTNLFRDYENVLILFALIMGGSLNGIFCFLYPFYFPESWAEITIGGGEIYLGEKAVTAIVLFLLYFLAFGIWVHKTKKSIKEAMDENRLNPNSIMKKFWASHVIYAFFFISIIYYIPENAILESAMFWIWSSIVAYTFLPLSYSNKIYTIIITISTIFSIILPIILIVTDAFGSLYTNVLHGSGATASQWAFSHLRKTV